MAQPDAAVEDLAPEEDFEGELGDEGDANLVEWDDRSSVIAPIFSAADSVHSEYCFTMAARADWQDEVVNPVMDLWERNEVIEASPSVSSIHSEYYDDMSYPNFFYYRSDIEKYWEAATSAIKKRNAGMAISALNLIISSLERAKIEDKEDRNYCNQVIDLAQGRLNSLEHVTWKPKAESVTEEIVAVPASFSMSLLPLDVMLHCMKHMDGSTARSFSKTCRAAYELFRNNANTLPRATIPKFTANASRIVDGNTASHVLSSEFEKVHYAHGFDEDLHRYTFLRNATNESDCTVFLANKGVLIEAYKDEETAIRDSLHSFFARIDVEEMMLNLPSSYVNTVADALVEIPRLRVETLKCVRPDADYIDAIGKLSGVVSKFVINHERLSYSVGLEEAYTKLIENANVSHLHATGYYSIGAADIVFYEMVGRLLVKLCKDWIAKKREVRYFSFPFYGRNQWIHNVANSLPRNAFELIDCDNGSILKLKRETQMQLSDDLKRNNCLYLFSNSSFLDGAVLATPEDFLFGDQFVDMRRSCFDADDDLW